MTAAAPDEFFDGAVILHRTECLACMSAMPDKCFDHVLTDPPYERHMHDAKSGVRGRKAYGARRIRRDGNADMPSIDFDSIDGVREESAAQMVRLCRGWLLVFCTPEGVAPWRDAIEAAGARYKRACHWIKPDAAPQFNGQGPAMAGEMFVAAWCGKGHARWNAGGKRGVYTVPVNPPDRHGGHPTEKPLALMSELLVDFTNEGDTVLDPFAGSGTTGVACLRTKRRAVLIEGAARYAAIAAERVAGAFDGPAIMRSKANKWRRPELLAAAPLFDRGEDGDG